MAPTDPPDREPRPAHRAMAAERLERVGTARRLEPAVWSEHRPGQPPVKQDWQHEQPGCPGHRPIRSLVRGVPRTHGRCHALTCRRSNLPSTRSSSAARTPWCASAARGLARMTSRLPAGSHPVRARAASRRRRRTLFLTTAPPTARVTTNPILGEVGPVSLASAPSTVSRCTLSSRPLARLPWRTASSNSWRRLIRAAAGSTMSPEQEAQPAQALRLARPFLRRAARIARPARVRIRNLKPCVFARRRLLG